MKKKFEKFSYCIRLWQILTKFDGSKRKYDVVPSLSLRDTSILDTLPSISQTFCCDDFSFKGSFTLLQTLKFLLSDTFEGCYDFEFSDLTIQLLDNIPFPFNYFDFRFVNHDDLKSFDVVITPYSFVDVKHLDDVEK